MRKLALVLLVPLLLIGIACGSGGGDDDQAQVSPQQTAPAQPQAKADNPVDKVTITSPVTITFYHTQTGPNAEKLSAIIKDFESKNPNIKVNAEYQGSYTDIYKKLLTSVTANQWPDMTVGYPSQFAEYQKAQALIPLDDYISSE